MPRWARTLAILGGLALVLLVATVWAWSALTQPLPGAGGTPACTDQQLARGDTLRSKQVLVDVENAGNRSGLASRVMQELHKSGFAQGELGNAPGGTEVRYVEIWTLEPDNPAVRLLASHFRPGTPIVRRDPVGDGITVVLGDDFRSTVPGARSLTLKQAATVCVAARPNPSSSS